MFGLAGIRGKEKRTVLNQYSSLLVLIFGVILGFMGFGWFGFWGAVLGFGLGVVLTGQFLTKGRFYR